MPLYLSHKAKRNLVLVLLFIMIVLIFVFLFLMRTPQVQAPVVEPVVIETPSEPTHAEVKEQKEIEVRTGEVSVTNLAKTFVERYGSYSNESDFANLEDVLVLMTEELANETRAFIETARAGETHYSITTRVISMEVEEQNAEEGYAIVQVTTQREEANGSPQNVDVRYQELVLELVYVDGAWKVSRATWE
jgi:biopolymer transport protein ExbD